MQNQELADLAAKFKKEFPRLEQMPVVSGFDAFVDVIISVVEERSGPDEWKPVSTMTQLAELIAAAAGKSSLREIIVQRINCGGCTVNLGDGLYSLGIPVYAFATMGEPIHSAFKEFAAKCTSCVSLEVDPGRTLALEFTDGKYMLSSVTQLAALTPEHLEKKLADGFYLDCCRRARMLALTNWSMYPHMTECWEKLNAEVFTSLKERPPLFIDLVDPSSRTETDISRMLQTVSRFEQNTQTILGLNGVEANVIARVLRIPEAKENPTELSEQAAALQKKLDIDTVVIHCVKLAAMANADGSVAVAGPYCPNPKKSTGAGDRFNAGFCTGVLLGLTPREKLLLGSACSGFFVREARSASAEELSQFIKEWSLGKI